MLNVFIQKDIFLRNIYLGTYVCIQTGAVLKFKIQIKKIIFRRIKNCFSDFFGLSNRISFTALVFDVWNEGNLKSHKSWFENI